MLYTDKRHLFSAYGRWSQDLSGSRRVFHPHLFRLPQNQTDSRHVLPTDTGVPRSFLPYAHGKYTDIPLCNRPVPDLHCGKPDWRLRHTLKVRSHDPGMYYDTRQRNCHSVLTLPDTSQNTDYSCSYPGSPTLGCPSPA